MENKMIGNVEREYRLAGKPHVLAPEGQVRIIESIRPLESGLSVHCRNLNSMECGKDIIEEGYCGFDLSLRDLELDYFSGHIESFRALQRFGSLTNSDFVSWEPFGKCSVAFVVSSEYKVLRPRLFRAMSEEAKRISREGWDCFEKDLSKGGEE
jgi:hypothetical protein